MELTPLVWTENNWASNQKIWVNVPIQYFEIYNQYGYNFLYSNSWFVVELTNLTLSRVLPRPTMSTTAPVLNWKWLPLFQFLICSETHALVLNWKWLGFESFEWMYPFNILKFETIWVNVPIQYFEIYNQYGYNFLYSNSWFVVKLRKQLGLKSENLNVPIQYFEIYNETISVNVPIQYFEIYNQWWVQFPLFQFLICSGTHKLDLVQGFAKACHEYHSPSVELEMITSIPIPDL